MHKFPEDHLKLIGKEISSCSPDEFLEQVSALRIEKKAKVKALKFKGCFVEKPTRTAKRNTGIYCVSYGAFTCDISFQRDLNIDAVALNLSARVLSCDMAQLRKFLATKKFILPKSDE